jgi:hypothetical protein
MSMANASLFRAVQVGGMAAGAVSLIAFAVLVLIARDPGRAVDLLRRVMSIGSPALSEKICRFTMTFVDGLAILRRPADAALALAGAFPLWFCSLVSIWSVCGAFHLGVPASGAFLLLMLVVIGISVPTPGGVGSVHYAFRIGATALYGAADDRAVGAALVLHAVTVLPVIAAGVVLAAEEGLSLQRLRGMAAAGRSAAALPANAGSGSQAV